MYHNPSQQRPLQGHAERGPPLLENCQKRRCLKVLPSPAKPPSPNGKSIPKLTLFHPHHRYRNFSTEEALIFSYVESASREGIWTRQIRAKTNLHPTVLNRYLKNLEKKRMIKATTNAKYPSRKTYILYNLVPSEEISGGCFYTDGKLDDEFIAALQKFAEHVIRTRSWVVEQAGGATLPPETGYKDYATLKDITRDFNESKVSNVSVREKEMLMVVDTLVWDGKVVRVMKGKAYKAVYPKMGMGDMENGLTQSPCGRCPVFDMCEEGGVVNAASCTYFQDWLALGEK